MAIADVGISPTKNGLKNKIYIIKDSPHCAVNQSFDSSSMDSSEYNKDNVSSTSQTKELVGDEVLDTDCGYGPTCKPKGLQKLANAKIYLLVMSVCVVIQGFAVNGISNVNTASYERRYLLTSKEAGIISSAFDITAGVTVGFVGYFGGRLHQPRLLAIAALFQAIGCFVSALAHFTAPVYNPYEISNSTYSENLCLPSDNLPAARCLDAERLHKEVSLKHYLYVLILGKALNGFAGTCYYSIGVTFLDESVSAKSSPLYLGIMMGMAAFGPALGFIAGGSLLSIYVDAPYHQPPNGLTQDDPRWVGAWWIGFIVSGCLSTLVVPVLFCFPRELPGTKEVKAKKLSEAHNSGTNTIVNAADFSFTWKNLPKVLWYLLRNPAYMFGNLKVTVLWCLATGFITFAAKFVHIQFNTSLSWSAMLVGFIGVPSAAFGQFIGGLICNRMKLTVIGLYRLLLIASSISLLISPLFWARCHGQTIFGFDKNTHNSSLSEPQLELSSACNRDCNCSAVEYQPICYMDVQYFSPCHAGCKKSNKKHKTSLKDSNKEFFDCTCIGLSENSKAVDGLCEGDCSLLYYVFTPLVFIMMFFLFLQSTPFTMVTMRIVPHKQRASAIAFQWIMMRFIGSLSGPILFGTLLDSSCLVWQEKCHTHGSCWIYQNNLVSQRIFLLVFGLLFLNFFFTLLAMLFYKPPPTIVTTSGDSPLNGPTATVENHL